MDKDSSSSSSLEQGETVVTDLSDNRIFIHVYSGFNDWIDADNEGKGLLHWLANDDNFHTREGDYQSHGFRIHLINYLIRTGANVDLKDKYNRTPLFEASITGFYLAADLFLEAGAEINSQSDSGKTPLHIVVLHGQTDLVELLLKNEANTEIADEEGCTPLHYTSDSDEGDKITELLLHYGAAVNVRDNNGWTPLHHAIICKKKAIIERLWWHENTDINVVNHDGETPLRLLAAYNINPLLDSYLADCLDNCVKSASDEPMRRCKAIFKLVLLENPSLHLPKHLNPPLSPLLIELADHWNCLQQELNAMLNEKITQDYSVYDLCLAENPVNLKSFLSDEEMLAKVEMLDLETNFPSYSAQLKSNLKSGKAFHQKIADTNYSLYDIYQEEDEAKLMTIFSDVRIENHIKKLLTSSELSDYFPAFLKERLEIILTHNLEIAIPKADENLASMIREYLFADEPGISNALSSCEPNAYSHWKTESSAIGNNKTPLCQRVGLFSDIKNPSKKAEETEAFPNKKQCMEKC